MQAPNDIVAIIAFLTTSIIVTGLTARLRAGMKDARASQQALVNTIPALVWSALPDGTRDFHSRRWLEYTGLSPEEGSGNGWLAALHPKDRARFMEQWHLAVTTGTPFEAEARGRSTNGEYRWFLVRAEPLRDDKGKIVKWYGTNIDIEDRRRATEALREGEMQWRAVFEHNPVMYFMVDAAGTVLSVNAFGATQLGYTPAELVGESVLNVFFQEDRDFVQRSVAVCLGNLGNSHSWEIRKVRKDGTVLWVRENAKAVQRADNQLIVLIACEDITERRRTEDALRLSETYMAYAQKVTGIGSWAYTASAVCEHWSAEMFRMFGFDPSKGYPPNELAISRVHPEDRQHAEDAVNQLFKDNRAVDTRYRVIRPDGQIRIIRDIGAPVLENGIVTRFVGACLDVTEEEKRIEELRRSQRYLAEAQRVSRTGTFYWGITTGEIFWSEGVFRIYGREPEEKPATELAMQRTHPEDLARVQRYLERMTEEENEWEIEYRLLMPDGTVKHIHAVNRTTKNALGSMELVGAVMDVTAVRRAEEELNKVRAELAHVARAMTLGELTAAIAHEVNQPLTGLVSSGNACLRWLASDPPNLEAARSSVERIVRNGNRAGDVIRRIRAMVRKSAPRKDRLDINDAIMEVIALIRTEAQRNRVSLETELSNDLPFILGDRTQLQQVILNLFMNAIEAVSGIDPKRRHVVITSGKEEPESVLVEVRDMGPGLEEADLDRLFEAFYTTKSDGMGMGLSISRTIIESHGGKLWAIPNLPQGATFKFKLKAGSEETS